MQRLLRCFSELDASLVLSVPRQDLIRAIMSQYDLSEDEAKTVILEKENELKEKVGSEGLNTRVFKRNGTVVYSSSERRASNDTTTSGGGGGADPRSPQQRMSPPASPHGIFASLSPRSGSPPNMESPLDYFGSPPAPTGGFQRSTGRLSVSSPASTGGGVSGPASSTPCASYSSLSIKKHDLMRGGLGATPTPTTSSLSRSMEDLLIDPISLELMKKPVMLPCGHSFSRRTITKWLQQQNKCPSCNTTATVEDMQPNYALRAVVRQYKKKEAKREAKSSSSTSSTSIITSESGSSIKKLSIPSSGKKSMKKEKKKKSTSSSKKSSKKPKKGDHDHRRDYPSGTGSGSGTGEEHLSPFAFFNAWVNGKDKKAKEERQARQRGDDDDQSDDDNDNLKSSPEHGGRTETSDAHNANVEAPAMTDDFSRQRSATVLRVDPQAAQLAPDQLGGAGGGIVLSGSWYDGFMDTIQAEPGAYQGFLGDSGASNFSASSLASSAATIITSASYFNDGANDGGDGGFIMGDGAMVGGHESVAMGGLIGDDGGDPMGSVGFTSSLFSFDEPSPGKGTAKQENEDEGENEDEEEEGEEEEEDEEESESESSDDDVVDGHAGSWPNKSETIVIDGRGDDDSESEQDRATSKREKAAKMHGLIERFKALSSSREKTGGARGSDSSDNDGSADGDNKRKTDSRDRDALNKAKQAAHEDNTNNSAGNEEEEEADDDAEEETEDEADDGGDDDDGEADGVSSSSSSSMTSSSSSMTNSGGATEESEQSEADRRRSTEAKRKTRKKKKTTAATATTTKTEEAEQKKLRRRTTDEESERKLRLALDVEVPHLRYDLQHKGIHVIVSVRAQSAPNASLRASSLVAAVGSPSQEKSGGGGGGSLHHHHHHVHNTGSGTDSSQALGGERAQIAVIAAIDRSSSMKGPKLSLVKESLLFLTSQLSPGDCMGLVSYDEEVTTEIPLTFLDDAGKDSVLKAVSNIKTGLWTNLSGGLFSALRLLEKLPSNHSNMVCSILLFTDGGANRGLTKTNLIVNALDTELRLLRTKSLAPTVFTFGFGSAPDANMLTKIAEMGNGLYYAIEAAEAIPTAFADCLGGLLSVSGTGVMINKIYGNQSVAEHSPHKSYSILLGDIYYEETRDVLLALTLPALEQPVDSFLILSATLTYSSLPGGRHTTISSECSVARPTALAIPGDSAPSYEVDKQRNRVHTADAIKQAIAEQEERRFDSAVAILSEAIQQIQQSASASDPFCVNLVENLNECIMRTKRAKASGRDNKISYQSSLALSHSRQRSTHVRGTLTYSTTAKASTTKKFQTVSKSLPVQASPQHSPQKVPRSHSDIKFLLANTKQLFERIRLIYALVEDQCNTKNCPNMTAGPKFEYLWKDEGRYKQATALPAPQYISLLFQTTEQIFTHTPSLPKIRDSLRRLFRVYAHIYHHHVSFFDDIGEMKLLQSSFIAFVRFVREHGLVDDRELLPMHALIQKLKFANA